jgi:hypothetical protein
MGTSWQLQGKLRCMPRKPAKAEAGRHSPTHKPKQGSPGPRAAVALQTRWNGHSSWQQRRCSSGSSSRRNWRELLKRGGQALSPMSPQHLQMCILGLQKVWQYESSLSHDLKCLHGRTVLQSFLNGSHLHASPSSQEGNSLHFVHALSSPDCLQSV